MVLTDLIKDQVFQSAIMFSAGLGFGMLYQVWEICRKAIVCRAALAQESHKRRIRALSSVLEFAFWPLAAFFVWEFMYYAAYGDISFHNFLALALGALLWRKAFYDIVY